MTSPRFLTLGKLTEVPKQVHLGDEVEAGTPVFLGEGERSHHVYLCGITGSGKSRFLENMIVQDIACGHPLCLLDPTGALYGKILDFVSASLDHAITVHRCTQEQIKALMTRFLFLDADDPHNPLVINPLEPHIGESTEELVDDLMKVIERIFGSLDEMRRIRQILRSALWVIAELSRLPARPSSLPALPLGLHAVGEFLALSPELRASWIEAVPRTEGNRYVLLFWQQFFRQYTTSQRMERIESTWNILQYFLGDVMVGRVLGASRSTIHIPELLRDRRSLLCSLPLGKNLKGAQIIGAYLATKFQRSAYRRVLNDRSLYSLYIDEFHEFADLEFAKASTTVRQYGLRLVNAHQSQSQPPFHTDEGRSLLTTIKGNSRMKILFRLPREDAEVMAKDVFALTQKKLNFVDHEVAQSLSEGISGTQSLSSSVSHGTGKTWSKAQALGVSESSSGTLGNSRQTSDAVTSSVSASVNCSRGVSITETESLSEESSMSIGRSQGTGSSSGSSWNQGVSEKWGSSSRSGRSTSEAVAQGTQVSHSSQTSSGVSRSQGQGGTSRLAGRSGRSVSDSSSSGSSLSVTDGSSRTQTSTASSSLSHGWDHSRGSSVSQGGSRGFSKNSSRTMTEGRSQERGTSVSRGESFTTGNSHGRSEARSHSVSGQASVSFSSGRGSSITQTVSSGTSSDERVSSGSSTSEGKSVSRSHAVTERKVFLTLEGEREVLVNRLQALPVRHAIIAKEALGAVEVVTPLVPDWYYHYQDEDMPAEILDHQRVRFLVDPCGDVASGLGSQGVGGSVVVASGEVSTLPSVVAPKEAVEWLPGW